MARSHSGKRYRKSDRSGQKHDHQPVITSYSIHYTKLYDVERFASLLGRLGFSTLSRAPADYGLPLILGGAEATLVDAASAYACLARMAKADDADAPGQFTGATWLLGDDSGLEPFEPPFSAGAAWLTLEALVDVGRPGEEASWQEYASSRRVAWKTGTSFGSRDAWAIGVTPEYSYNFV